jgi:putative endonuclease
MRYALNGKSTHIKDDSMDRQPAVYLPTNRAHGTLYIGVTSDLVKRVWQYINTVVRGFTAKFNLSRLVYFELFEDMFQTTSREKQLKAGSRKAKMKLIESVNPDWRDPYMDIGT